MRAIVTNYERSTHFSSRGHAHCARYLIGRTLVPAPMAGGGSRSSDRAYYQKALPLTLTQRPASFAAGVCGARTRRPRPWQAPSQLGKHANRRPRSEQHDSPTDHVLLARHTSAQHERGEQSERARCPRHPGYVAAINQPAIPCARPPVTPDKWKTLRPTTKINYHNIIIIIIIIAEMAVFLTWMAAS